MLSLMNRTEPSQRANSLRGRGLLSDRFPVRTIQGEDQPLFVGGVGE
jgi:hypothetical protein